MTRSGRVAAAVLGAWLGLGLATSGLAQPPDGPPPHDRRGPPHGGRPKGPPPIERTLERHAERLGLTDEERAEIDRVAEASRTETDALREQLRAFHDQMRRLLSEDSPDVEAVMAQAEKIGAAETELQKARLRSMLAIRALLTPEQRAELVEIHEERKQRRQQRGDRRRHGPGPPD